jgi:3',5'-cyclic-nucleotide phosphodiesterase
VVRPAAMDYAACNVVYVDRTARDDRLAKREDAIPGSAVENHVDHDEGLARVNSHPTALESNLRTLLETFSEGRFSPSQAITFS